MRGRIGALLAVVVGCGGGGPESAPAQGVAASLQPFAINGFYVQPMLAQNQGIRSPEDLRRHLLEEKIPHYRALGATWGRIHPEAFGGFSWGAIDLDRDGMGFDFAFQDVYVQVAQENGISLLPSLGPFKPQEPSEWTVADSFVPNDLGVYRAYVRATVERYDGDGTDDLPGLGNPIKVWQLDNEADLHNYKRDGNYSGFESPEEYATVLAGTYSAMKEADPEARLMINLAGLGQMTSEYGLGYLDRLLEAGAAAYLEILSYHVYPMTYDFAEVERELEEMRARLGDIPIWITETSITSVSVAGFADPADEAAQARWLAKNYAFHAAQGVERVFWLAVTDMSPSLGEQTFSYTGLMTFGPPASPKAAYYTFQLLASRLAGAESAHSEGTGRHVFTFSDGRRIYVLWGEGTVDLGFAGEVEMTPIVEDASQAEVESVIVSASAVPVSDTPVLVEVRGPS